MEVLVSACDEASPAPPKRRRPRGSPTPQRVFPTPRAASVWRVCNYCSETFRPLTTRDSGHFRGCDVFCNKFCQRQGKNRSLKSRHSPKKKTLPRILYNRAVNQARVFEEEGVSAFIGTSLPSEGHVVAVGTPDFCDGSDILRFLMKLKAAGMPEADAFLKHINDAIRAGPLIAAGAMFDAAAIIKAHVAERKQSESA